MYGIDMPLLYAWMMRSLQPLEFSPVARGLPGAIHSLQALTEAQSRRPPDVGFSDTVYGLAVDTVLGYQLTLDQITHLIHDAHIQGLDDSCVAMFFVHGAMRAYCRQHRPDLTELKPDDSGSISMDATYFGISTNCRPEAVAVIREAVERWTGDDKYGALVVAGNRFLRSLPASAGT